MLSADATPADLETHVDALLDALTDDETLSLLHSCQPAIERLGLTAFNTGGEAVHGVAWLGAATVFPQPPGLAAMWDDDLLQRVGEAAGREVRAKHAEGRTHLNCWAPVVNPLRNPLWGRNEEAYSEDPWVTSRCAIAYARGLRGDHGTYWRTLPTLKHVLGYNNETDRCTSSSDLSARDLHEYELPAFLGPLAAGSIAAVMPAYNLVNGRPVHIAADLFDALREVDEHVIAVSDAYAGMNLHQAERAAPDMATGHAAAVRAGLDSFTELEHDSAPTVAALREALDRGLLGRDEVRTAARRLLLARARTGEFTEGGGPFADDGALETPDHAALALEAAAAQVTVLTNDGCLPLTDPGRVVVVGPMADQVLLDWYSGTPTHSTSLAAAAGADWGATSDDGSDHLQLSTADGRQVRVEPDGTLVAGWHDPSVFEVTRWQDDVVTVRDQQGGKLLTGADWFAVKATSDRAHGWVCHEAFTWVPAGEGRVRLRHRGTRMWVRVEPFSGVLSMSADAADRATVFTVETLSDGVERVAHLATTHDTVVLALGNEPHLHGRETEDRTTLDLPWRQRELAGAAASDDAVTRIALVVSSYPFAVGELVEHYGAVVWSSHAGQALGPALVEVLDGRREPRGRIAQTWWASDDDLADVLDYRLLESRQTAWYSPATPLFALGHGLTYSTVEHRGLSLSGTVADDSLVATVTVANTGDRVAHELVQVHADGGPDWGTRIVGWQRVTLQPGQVGEVSVAVPAEHLRQWDVRTDAWGWPASWTLSTGPSLGTVVHAVELVALVADETPRAWPLLAWHADSRHDLVGVPTELLRGTALAGRPEGRATFRSVEGRSAVAAVVRNPHGSAGELVVRSGVQEARVEVAPHTDWTTALLDLRIDDGADIEVHLRLVELDRLTT